MEGLNVIQKGKMIMAKRIKRNYDRRYVDACDKIRVFIESRAKVMFVEHNYKSSEIARAAYRQAVDRVRCGSMVRVIVSKGELFLIRKDI